LKLSRESSQRIEDVKIYSERVTGTVASKAKIDYTCQLLAVAMPVAEYSYIRESGAVEGSVSAVLVYEQDEQIKSTIINLPFAIVLKGIEGDGKQIMVSVAAYGISVRQRTEGEVECEAAIKIVAEVSGDVESSYLTEIVEDGDVEICDSALSVYIPQSGDGLWDIAKKLKSSPADVLACNPQLSYPLTGKERILIYRQST
jgi:hypothetical protein